MAETAAALTDLALGLVTVGLVPTVGVRAWRRTVWWAGAAALSGAAYHAFIAGHRAGHAAFTVVSVMVVVTISCLLSATVDDVLGPGHHRLFWILRLATLSVYGVVAVSGHASTGAMLACEGVTMACVLVLWGLALRRGHPRAARMTVALGASALAGLVRALPSGSLGLDSTSAYHLAQIPPMVLLCWAVRPRVSEPAGTFSRSRFA